MAGIDSDLIRGHIDTIILKSLFEGDKYGLEIIQEIEEKSNGSYELKQPTLYSCLKRLENQGLISSYWEDSEIGGKRHYYTLTDLGKEEYQNNQKEWLRSKEIIDNLIYNDAVDATNEELPIVDQLNEENCEDNNEENSIDDIHNNENVDSNIEYLDNGNIDEQEANLLNSINSSDFEQVDNTNFIAENIDYLQNESLILEDYQDDNFIDNLDKSNKENLESEESQTLNDFENSSEDFQFSSFDEIERTAFGTFFEANNEVSSADELDDEFDEPTTNYPTLSKSSLSDDASEPDNLEEQTTTSDGSPYVSLSLLDVLAQSADENNEQQTDNIAVDSEESDDVGSINETPAEQLYNNETAEELDEAGSEQFVNDESGTNQEDTENLESEQINIDDDNVNEENFVEDQSSATLLDDELTADEESLTTNESLENQYHLEVDELPDDEQDDQSLLLDELTLSEDNSDEQNNTASLADSDNDKVYGFDDDIYNSDDEIYNSIPEDEQIYVPQDDEETNNLVAYSDESADNLQLTEEAEELGDEENLLYSDDNLDESNKTEEVITPTYINFGTHTYEEADITKNHEEIDDLYNLDNESNQDNNVELNDVYNLADDTEANIDELDTSEPKPIYEEPKPMYRASQEEIESLYKTTENYENLQAGYTDETYKQMLNELENYGSTTEEVQQRPTAKTFEELSADFEKNGIEIRKYTKQQKESNDTKIYIKTHQINMVKNWITFGISTFAILITFFIMNAFKENYTYPFSFAPFAIAIGVSALFPLYSTILYFANPYKKVVAKYAPRLSILLSVMINIQLILIIYCLNLQLGFYSFAQENYNHLMWILPLILSFIPTIQSIIYYPLYMSKNYHT